MSDLYAADGVNLTLGDKMSKFAAEMCNTTRNNSRHVRIVDFSSGHFRGPRGDAYHGLPPGWFNQRAPDGIGSKVIIHSAAKGEYNAPWDVLAMTAGDISRWGGLPLVFSNVLDVATLGASEESETFQRFKELFRGLAAAACEIGVVLQGGETAELGVCVGSEDSGAVTKFNWAGFMCGVNTPDKIITGRDIEAGDVVIALQERGFRSNGLSAVRKALRQKFGDVWFKNLNDDAQEALRAAATPAVLYDKFLATAQGWYNRKLEPQVRIKGLAHISGGGIPSKFGEILFPTGLSAALEDLFDPPSIMHQCAEWRGMSERAFYDIFNGGQGVLAVVGKGEKNNFMSLARDFNVQTKECGSISASSPKGSTLTISSKFQQRKVLDYYPGR